MNLLSKILACATSGGASLWLLLPSSPWLACMLAFSVCGLLLAVGDPAPRLVIASMCVTLVLMIVGHYAGHWSKDAVMRWVGLVALCGAAAFEAVRRVVASGGSR